MTSNGSFGSCPIECLVQIEGREAVSPLAIAMVVMLGMFVFADFMVGFVAVLTSAKSV